MRCHPRDRSAVTLFRNIEPTELIFVDLFEAGALGVALVNHDPQLLVNGDIVLECTNMEPYAVDIRRLSSLPVPTKNRCLIWFQSGLMQGIAQERVYFEPIISNCQIF